MTRRSARALQLARAAFLRPRCEQRVRHSRERVDQVLESLLADQPSGGGDEQRVVGGAELLRAASVATPRSGLKRPGRRRRARPRAIGIRPMPSHVREVGAAGGDEPGAAEGGAGGEPRRRQRSATKTSEPCRLMTSGSPGAAIAAVTPPGTTQCPCMTVALYRRATSPRRPPSGASASGAATYAAPRSADVRMHRRGVAEDVQRRERRVLVEVEMDAVFDRRRVERADARARRRGPRDRAPPPTSRSAP